MTKSPGQDIISYIKGKETEKNCRYVELGFVLGHVQEKEHQAVDNELYKI